MRNSYFAWKKYQSFLRSTSPRLVQCDLDLPQVDVMNFRVIYIRLRSGRASDKCDRPYGNRPVEKLEIQLINKSARLSTRRDFCRKLRETPRGLFFTVKYLLLSDLQTLDVIAKTRA